MAVRVFSIRTGLAASTDTPGRTPPEASRTIPATLCAPASEGIIKSPSNASTLTCRYGDQRFTGPADLVRLIHSPPIQRTDRNAQWICQGASNGEVIEDLYEVVNR